MLNDIFDIIDMVEVLGKCYIREADFARCFPPEQCVPNQANVFERFLDHFDLEATIYIDKGIIIVKAR